jgi:hypothetical protein
MTKDQIKVVLDRVLTWPRQRQEDAAQLLLDMQRDGGDSVRLTDEQVAEVERRLAEPEPTFLTLEDVRARLAKRRA